MEWMHRLLRKTGKQLVNNGEMEGRSLYRGVRKAVRIVDGAKIVLGSSYITYYITYNYL